MPIMIKTGKHSLTKRNNRNQGDEQKVRPLVHLDSKSQIFVNLLEKKEMPLTLRNNYLFSNWLNLVASSIVSS